MNNFTTRYFHKDLPDKLSAEWTFSNGSSKLTEAEKVSMVEGMARFLAGQLSLTSKLEFSVDGNTIKLN